MLKIANKNHINIKNKEGSEKIVYITTKKNRHVIIE